MKNLKVVILLISISCLNLFSQINTDTICYMLAEKRVIEFDYAADTILNSQTEESYKALEININ